MKTSWWNFASPSRRDLIEGRLPRGKLILLAGEGGVGKSMLLLDLFEAVTRGCAEAFGGRVIGGPQPCLLLTGEDDRASIDLRLKIIRQGATGVLIGQNTANRKWINHEIIKAWDSGLGVVGIRIHGLKNFKGETATQGNNPFDYVNHGPTGKKLSSIVKCYNPAGSNSNERYSWITEHLANAVEEAIKIRGANV